MLRVYFLQNRHALSDPTAEEIETDLTRLVDLTADREAGPPEDGFDLAEAVALIRACLAAKSPLQDRLNLLGV